MTNLTEENHRHHDVSPLFIGLLGVIAGAIIVATLHFMLLGWCKTEEIREEPLENQRPWRNVRSSNSTRDHIATSSSSRSNSSVQSIPSVKYTKECHDGSCTICLGEFRENENLRTLPECEHYFHVPCIDKWLSFHLNCPICRADVVPEQGLLAVPIRRGSSFDAVNIVIPEYAETLSSQSGTTVSSEHVEHVVAAPSDQNVVTILTGNGADASSPEINFSGQS